MATEQVVQSNKELIALKFGTDVDHVKAITSLDYDVIVGHTILFVRFNIGQLVVDSSAPVDMNGPYASLVAVQPTVQPEYTPLTNDEYSDLMTALQVACGERSPAMPLSHNQVIAIRDLWCKLATQVIASRDLWGRHTEQELQTANDETLDAFNA